MVTGDIHCIALFFRLAPIASFLGYPISPKYELIEVPLLEYGDISRQCQLIIIVVLILHTDKGSPQPPTVD